MVHSTPRRVRRFLARLTGALACCALGAVSAMAQEARTLSDAEEELSQYTGRLAQLSRDYARPPAISRAYDINRALNDGSVRYLLGDYESAAIIFERLLDERGFESHVGYPSAVFYLADSYFMSRNYLRARRYYEETLSIPDREYHVDAALRLIDLATILGQFNDADQERYYNVLERSGDTTTAYQRGKALYFQGRYRDAITALGSVPADTEPYDRAVYLTGVSYARLDQFEPALERFDALVERTPVEDELYALSQLARGRVYYEQQEFRSALDAYSAVPPRSSHIQDALYETAWSFVSLGQIADAIFPLEVIRTLADPNGRSRPEAELLLGDLRLRVEEYETAVEIFDGVSERYYPVQLEMEEFAATIRDPGEFFDRVVDSEDRTLLLPPLASAWFTTDPTLERSLAAWSDVEQIREDIEESRQMIRELEAALQPGANVNIFPGLREGWATALEIESNAILLWASVVEMERRSVDGQLTSAAASAYGERNNERRRLQAQFERAPRDFQALQTREESVTDSMSDISVDAFRAEIEVGRALAEIDSLRELLRLDARSGRRTRQDVARMERELDAVERRFRGYDDRATALQNDISVAQIEVSVADDVTRAERELKRALVRALQSEGGTLDSVRTGSDGGRYAALYSGFEALQSDIDSFFVSLDRVLIEQTVDFRSALNEERANVERYERELAQHDSQSRELLGELAYGAALGVRDRFAEITLRANLGIIDVAWRQKENLTDEIDMLFQERNQRLSILDADFAEILGDE